MSAVTNSGDYVLPRAGTLVGLRRLTNENLVGLSDAARFEEGVQARLALGRVLEEGDRVLCNYPRRLTVARWLRERIAVIDTLSRQRRHGC